MIGRQARNYPLWQGGIKWVRDDLSALPPSDVIKAMYVPDFQSLLSSGCTTEKLVVSRFMLERNLI
jgi:hypothetical protein